MVSKSDAMVQNVEEIKYEPHHAFVPGTTDMKQVQVGTTGSRLVPQPSDDAADPLNWSSPWKYLEYFAHGCFTFFGTLSLFAISPLYGILMAKWHKNEAAISQLTGINAATYGTANLILIPLANAVGRRPVALICCLIILGANIWSAMADSYSSFLGARVLSGLGSAANETLMAVVATDIFFLQRRATAVGVFFFTYSAGAYVGPVLSGAFAEHVGYQWFYWFCAICVGCCVILLLFLAPETQRTTFEGQILSSTRVAEDLSHRIMGRPSLRQFLPVYKVHKESLKGLNRQLLAPFCIMLLPIGFWAVVMACIAANTLLVVQLTMAQALGSPPYLWGSQKIGFTNFALLVGSVIGTATAGPLSDWVAMRATKKNGGIREPEMRLPAMIPFFLLTVLGMVMYGISLDRKWPAEVCYIVGMPAIAVIVVGLQTIPLTYAIDCYQPASGPIMGLSTVIKNMFGFGMTYYINDWVTRVGYLVPSLVFMALTAGFGVLGLAVLMPYGKTFRRMSMESFVHRL